MTQNLKTSEADQRSLPMDAPARYDGDGPEDHAGLSQGDPRTTSNRLPGNAEKDPDQWTTGGETMTGAQASYLQTLCDEAGEPFDPTLSKADASKRIDALQSRTGRGRDH
jgi:hypothetical protein